MGQRKSSWTKQQANNFHRKWKLLVCCLFIFIALEFWIKCMKCHYSPDLCTQVGVRMSEQRLHPELKGDIQPAYQRLRGLLGLPTNLYFKNLRMCCHNPIENFGSLVHSFFLSFKLFLRMVDLQQPNVRNNGFVLCMFILIKTGKGRIFPVFFSPASLSTTGWISMKFLLQTLMGSRWIILMTWKSS